MWQRLQTLYLAIATVLVVSMFFVNFATVASGDASSADAWKYTDKLAWLLFLISLASANIIALFTFKARLLQMRVSILAALLLVGFQIWIGVDFFKYRNDMVFSVSAVFPIVAAILDALAARAIALDEAMVQAASRLRKRRK